jgi:hypothetical protein
VLPRSERCGNDVDDDCDGEADEGCGCVPQPEICGNDMDDDCDGVRDDPACRPQSGPRICRAPFAVGWARGFGAGGADVGRTVAVGPEGNAWLGATYESGQPDFGTGPLASGQDDVAVGKYAADDGDAQWTFSLNGPGLDSPNDLAVTGTGEAWLSVQAQNSLRAEDSLLVESSSTSYQFLLARLDERGSILSHRVFADDTAIGQALEIDGRGRLYASGSYILPPNFGGGTLEGPDDGGFLASFDQGGAHRWSFAFDANAASLELGNGGNLYVSGRFTQPADFGGGQISPRESCNELFLASYGAEGGYRWALSCGGSIAPAPGGGVYVAGLLLDQTVELGDFSIEPGPSTGFVAHFDAGGNVVWARALPIYPRDLVTTAEGCVLAMGDFGAAVSFAGERIEPAGDQDTLALAVGPGGEDGWARALGADLFVRSLAADGDRDRVYVTGSYTTEVELGDRTLGNRGRLDALLVQLRRP